MSILVTGASSYVGAGIYHYLKKKLEVIGTYNANRLFPELVKLDITKRDDVIRLVRNIRPEVIIHVAANASASWCEAHPDLAKQLNEAGTKNVVDAANLVKSKVIYVSSIMAITAESLYGKTKRTGEELVKRTLAGFVILQPSFIIGYSPNTTNDRPFNRILKNLTHKIPAVYDTSWKFQPTWLGHVSEVVEQVIMKNITNEVIPVVVPELKSRFDVAKDILVPFDIAVTAKDDNDKTPVTTVTQTKLKRFGLPQYSYPEIIEKILLEIKHNLKPM